MHKDSMVMQVVPVKVVVLPNGSGLPLPSYATLGSAGMDLVAAIPQDNAVALPPGVPKVVPTGIAVAIPPGYEIQVRPRSGLALRYGITVLNAPGTIDEDYRGEIGVILFNAGKDPFVIRRGDRIAQAVLAPVSRLSWEVVDTLDATDRGQGGFGSTGTA